MSQSKNKSKRIRYLYSHNKNASVTYPRTAIHTQFNKKVLQVFLRSRHQWIIHNAFLTYTIILPLNQAEFYLFRH